MAKISNSIGYSAEAEANFNVLLADIPENWDTEDGATENEGVYAYFNAMDAEFGGGWQAKFPIEYNELVSFIRENEEHTQTTGKVRIYGKDREVSYFLGLSDKFEHAGE